jgi:HSP20 family protein
MMRRMQDEMDRVFGQFFGGQGPWGQGGGGMQAWSPSVDMHETENEYVVRADVPGVEPEDLELLCAEDRLILRGETRREQESRDRGLLRSERRFGRFERVLPLPPGVQQDQIQASFRNGVLELRIPKSEESRQKIHRIPIQGGRTLSGAKGGEVSSVEGEQGASAQTAGAGESQAAARSDVTEQKGQSRR